MKFDKFDEMNFTDNTRLLRENTKLYSDLVKQVESQTERDKDGFLDEISVTLDDFKSLLLTNEVLLKSKYLHLIRALILQFLINFLAQEMQTRNTSHMSSNCKAESY